MFSIEDLLTRRLVEQTGFPVAVGRVKANPLTGRFSVEDLEIRNPERFPRPDFLVAPEVRGQASPTTLLSRHVQIRELSVHLRRLTGIRSATGKINFAEFRRGLEEREERGEARESSGRRVTVGRLRVKLDAVEVVDFAEELGRREYPVAIDETFSEVTDPIALAPHFVELFAGAGLSQAENPIFAGFLPDLLWMEIRALLRPSLAHLIELARE